MSRIVLFKHKHGPTYYVANAGSDSNSGKSPSAPWQTLAKVQASAYNAGDTVRLNRGDLWREELDFPSSGTAGRPITLADYGSGALPIISGAAVMGGTWTAQSGSGGANLITNPVFATFDSANAPHGWTVTGTATAVTKETSSPITGTTTACRINGFTGLATIAQTNVVTGGIGYTLSFGQSVGDASSPTYQVKAVGGAHDGHFLQGDGTFAAATNTFTYTGSVNPASSVITKTFTTPSDATSITVLFSDVASHNLWVSNVSLATVAAPTTTYATPLVTQPFVVARNDVRLVKGGSATTLTNNQWFWLSGQLYVRDDSGSPSLQTIEAGARNHGIFLNSVTDVVLRNLQVEKTNDRIVRLNSAHRAQVRGCTVRCGGQLQAGGGIGISGANDVQIVGNVMADIQDDGIYGFNALRPLITDNTMTAVFGSTSDNIQMDYDATNHTLGAPTILRNHLSQFGTDAIKGNIIVFGDGATINDNYCEYGSFGIAAGIQNCTALRNVFYNTGFYDNTGGAIHIDTNYAGAAAAYDNHLYANNVMIACARGILIGDDAVNHKTNFRFYHNTISGGSQQGAVYLGAAVSGAFENNIIWYPSTTNIVLYTPGGTTGTWTSDYNIIGPERTGFITWGAGQTAYNTLAAYQAGAVEDAHSLKNDPLFANSGGVTAVDYLLGASSPAIDAGTVIAGINDGTAGSTHYLGAAPDMGYAEKA